jgi:hypothetical protein
VGKDVKKKTRKPKPELGNRKTRNRKADFDFDCKKTKNWGPRFQFRFLAPDKIWETGTRCIYIIIILLIFYIYIHTYIYIYIYIYIFVNGFICLFFNYFFTFNFKNSPTYPNLPPRIRYYDFFFVFEIFLAW